MPQVQIQNRWLRDLVVVVIAEVLTLDPRGPRAAEIIQLNKLEVDTHFVVIIAAPPNSKKQNPLQNFLVKDLKL